MAKKTYVSPGIMLLAADPGTDLKPFSDQDNSEYLSKPGEFDDFEDDDEAYRTLW